MPVVSTSRISALFRGLREQGKKALVIYVTAGDPSLEATGEILQAVDQGGADIIELGVPFSDPLADGPVIQRASERALRAGTTLRKIMGLLPGWRSRIAAPIIAFSYYNPILQYGLDAFARDARAAGMQGVLAVDLAPEEAGDYLQSIRAQELDPVFLAAPTSTDERLQRVAEASSGFLYVVSRSGVTGERNQLAAALSRLVRRVRSVTSLPLAVGFGISNPQQVRAVQELADAAVVGSAIVRAIEQRYAAGGGRAIRDYVRWLKEGTGSEPA